MEDTPKRFCLKRENLQQAGYKNLKSWIYTKNNIYITSGKMKYCQSADKDSKWENPYSLWEYDEEESLKFYEEHIRSKVNLMRSIPYLAGKNLGCWCQPEYKYCHGRVLIKLFEEMKNKRGMENKRPLYVGAVNLMNIKKVEEVLDVEEEEQPLDVEEKEMKNKRRKNGDKKKNKKNE